MESGKLPVLRSTERCRAESRGRPPAHIFCGRIDLTGHDAKPIFRANGRRVAVRGRFCGVCEIRSMRNVLISWLLRFISRGAGA